MVLRINLFDGFVNGFFKVFFGTRPENRTLPDGFGDLLASLGTLPRISKSNTIFDRFKLNSNVEAIDTLEKPVESS